MLPRYLVNTRSSVMMGEELLMDIRKMREVSPSAKPGPQFLVFVYSWRQKVTISLPAATRERRKPPYSFLASFKILKASYSTYKRHKTHNHQILAHTSIDSGTPQPSIQIQ